MFNDCSVYIFKWSTSMLIEYNSSFVNNSPGLLKWEIGVRDKVKNNYIQISIGFFGLLLSDKTQNQ